MKDAEKRTEKEIESFGNIDNSSSNDDDNQRKTAARGGRGKGSRGGHGRAKKNYDNLDVRTTSRSSTTTIPTKRQVYCRQIL